jgi:GDPmannose 4,6-dehydratase
MAPKALITGISGQTGSYLAALLFIKGYEVSGIIRRSSSINTTRIDPIFSQLHLYYGDMTDADSLNRIVREVQPDETYNLAAQSHVRTSFDIPVYTADADALGTLRLLEAVRNNVPQSKFYQASSSEMFGSAAPPQNETTPFHPRSPYAVAKVFAYHAAVNYRESYGMFVSNGILFNHESSRRGETFVTRKIVKGLINIKRGLQTELRLGNLNAKRDWGYAGDYAEAIWRILQHSESDDFVVATGETYSVREFLDEAADLIGIDWTKYVVIDPKYYRPAEVDVLQGDASKIKRVLGWEPKITFSELVRLMVAAERSYD